ncbi:S-adenosyl-L-methionine-dependent methyltransferase [Dendrothele bispora CBS 962.96]|uniref:S-adenosyl-L-methionine-dependent methyltransferase n=1 Tax=Dendrothele bispora (strain CBS 962.96) TaxID=1314807 RepID=A0A4S8MS63_DENBC|nr:S-adenosyl-L-methionine-dependent methyltransferase [Dendrothele bispora CBS 962.96]
MSGDLTSLLSIINTQTSILQSAYAKSNTPFPSIDDSSFNPASSIEMDPQLARTRQLIVAAASQLIASVQPPAEIVQDAALAFVKTSALGFLVDINVPEALKGGNPEGMHVDELGKATGVDPSYIARALRYLSTRHIFTEVSPNVFKHNRNSLLATKSKSLAEVKKDPLRAFEKAPLAAFVGLLADEGMKSGCHLSPHLQNPRAPSPFSLMSGTNTKRYWDILKEPGNEFRDQRFIAMMDGQTEAHPEEIVISGINGNALAQNGVVVELGGNVGTATFRLKKTYPHLKYVVQDLKTGIDAAEVYWKERDAGAVTSGQVSLQVHNFFDPQPVKNAAVYFLHSVLHDWDDPQARKMLSNIRGAAGSNSKLVIFDMLTRYSIKGSKDTDEHSLQVPDPLLANLGIAMPTAMDMSLLMLLGGKGRTRDDFEKLAREAGWKLESVKVDPTVIFSMATLTFSAA